MMIKTIVAGVPIVGYLANRFYFSGANCNCKNDLHKKVVVITGANTGIGYETALSLAECGAQIVLACRNMTAGERAVDEIKKQTKNMSVVAEHLDLADLKSVREFVERYRQKFNRLDVLINNAAIMNCPKSKTKDGFEMQFGVNHLGHFLLTRLLLDLIKQSPDGRIINLSSVVHEYASMHWDDLMLEKKYGANTAYRQSKLANVLFTLELSKRLKDTNVKAVSLHPGVVRTSLSRYEKEGLGLWAPVTRTLIYPLWYVFTKTPKEGAQTSIHCALSNDIISGAYYSDCKTKTPSKRASDSQAAKRLWDISSQLVGLENN